MSHYFLDAVKYDRTPLVNDNIFMIISHFYMLYIGIRECKILIISTLYIYYIYKYLLVNDIEVENIFLPVMINPSFTIINFIVSIVVLIDEKIIKFKIRFIIKSLFSNNYHRRAL